MFPRIQRLNLLHRDSLTSFSSWLSQYYLQKIMTEYPDQPYKSIKELALETPSKINVCLVHIQTKKRNVSLFRPLVE